MMRSITFFTNFIKRGLIPTALVGWLVGCETVVDIDLPQEPPRLVVNHTIEVGPFGVNLRDLIRVAQSQSVLDNSDVLPVSGAVVTMQEEGECTMLPKDNEDCTVVFEETNLSLCPGCYSQSFSTHLSPGRTYTLRIEKEGFESVTATTHIPEPTKIQQLDYDTTVVLPPAVSQRSFSVNELKITLDDPAGERNYYAIRVQATRRREECDSVGNCVLSNSSSSLFYVDMSSDNPAIVSSNYGLQGSTTQIYGTVIPFNDDLFDGERYTIGVTTDVFFYGDSLRPNLNVELITMTQEQYDYTYNSWLQQSLQEIPYSEPVLVPGIIQGGYGIFAGYSVDEATIDFR